LTASHNEFARFHSIKSLRAAFFGQLRIIFGHFKLTLSQVASANMVKYFDKFLI